MDYLQSDAVITTSIIKTSFLKSIHIIYWINNNAKRGLEHALIISAVVLRNFLTHPRWN